jgi:transcriptional regulator with XRE-family HTH domain
MLKYFFFKLRRNIDMTLFERTKEFSKKRGYSLQTTAEKAGLSQNAIYRWKTTNPSEVSVKAVADVLGVSSDYLLGNTNEPTPSRTPDEMTPLELDKALSEEGVVMFDGKPLSESYKKTILSVIQTMREDK